MSVETLAAVLHHSRAKGTAKVVAIGIANHDGDGGAWPSIRTLAIYANVDRSTVKRAVRSLVVLGEVRVHLQAGGPRDMEDHDRPNRYEVLIDCPEGCDRTSNHKPRKGWQRGKDGSYVRLDEEGDVPLWINPGGTDAPGCTDAPTPRGTDAPRTVPVTPSDKEGASTTGRGRVTGWCDECGLTFDAHLVAIERHTFPLHNFTAPPRRDT